VKRATLWAAAVLVVAGLAVGGWYVYSHPVVQDFQRMDAREMTLDQARTALRDAGMEVNAVATRVVSEGPGLHQIVWQMNGDVRANGDARVPRGTTITLEYAIRMEPVKGLSRDDAVRRLTASGIPEEWIRIIGRATAVPSEVGVVLEQLPDPGPPPTPGGGVIRLLIGVGDAPVAVPSWIGRPYCEARKALDAQGLRVVPRPDGAAGGAGEITEQNPRDTSLRPNDQIALTYSGTFRDCWPFVPTPPKIKTLSDFRTDSRPGGSP
jgi:beta-lactam-binding protein with PASTA domain